MTSLLPLIYETHIFQGDNIPFWMLYQYQHIRYRFIKQTDWDVPLDHDKQLEMDEFDHRSETVHVLVTVFDQKTRQVKVVAGVRLIQTIYPYQLQNDSYDEMKRGFDLPVSPDFVEGSRWVSKVDGSEAANTAISLLMQAMQKYCSERNISTLIAGVPRRWEQWLNAYGIETLGHRETDVYKQHKEQYLIIQFPLNNTFASAGEVQREQATKVSVAA